MRLLLVSPGASWSTIDVYDGLRDGLIHHGVDVVDYLFDTRIEISRRALNGMVRLARKKNPSVPKPSSLDILYLAGVNVIEKALRHQVNAVLIVSSMLLHPDIIILARRAGVKVFVLFTESPYDLAKELAVAKLCDGCWTNERSCVDAFRAVNPNSGYVPHAWNPAKHTVEEAEPQPVHGHDVVFVGTGWQERIEWFNAIDWTGIDLGLYGTWKSLGLKKAVKEAIRGTPINNTVAAGLYRRAKIGLNLYRTSIGWGRNAPKISHAESLSPRAYELAACGAFHLSDYRAEVPEVFGDLVPTFRTASEAAALIRLWLADDAGRRRVAEALPAAVAEASWRHRAITIIGDLQTALAVPDASARRAVGG